jgi:hypothetical protein
VRWTSPRAKSACCLAGAAEDAKEQICMTRRRRGDRKKVEERCCEQGSDLAVAVGDGGREGGLTLSSLEGCGARRVERGRGRGNMLHVAIGGVWSRL